MSGVSPSVCPHHGEVEGGILVDGPLSNTVPIPVVCEECDAEGVTTIIDYDEDDDA